MLSFSQVAEALMGLIYHRPSGENFSSSQGLSLNSIVQVMNTYRIFYLEIFDSYNPLNQLYNGLALQRLAKANKGL